MSEISSIATTQTPATGAPRTKQLGDLPKETFQQILGNIGEPSRIILVNDDGTEYELLTGERKQISTVCKAFHSSIHSVGTTSTARHNLPKTHVYRGGFEFFFGLSADVVQSRIDRLADAHKAKSVTELSGSNEFYPRGWSEDRYEDFVNSSKNNISVLVIPTAHSSSTDISKDSDLAFSFRHAKAACIGLREIMHWAMTKGNDGRLLPNLTRIVVPEDKTWKFSLGEGDIEEVDTRATPGCAWTTPTGYLYDVAIDVAYRLNESRYRLASAGPDRERARQRHIVVSTTLTDPPMVEYDSDDLWWPSYDIGNGSDEE